MQPNFIFPLAAYKIKEIYYTLQGEGYHTGRPAVFCRFTGCNLWSGREEDRSGAICDFCDTDFVGMNGPQGGRYSAEELCRKIKETAPSDNQGRIYCVFTGGEPLLQLDEHLIQACHNHNILVAVETNGTIKAPEGIDWLCVSPKAGSEWIQKQGNELKLVVPQPVFDPAELLDLNFDHFSLQPMDGPKQAENTAWTIDYCLEHPQWSLSMQTHKYLGLD